MHQYQEFGLFPVGSDKISLKALKLGAWYIQLELIYLFFFTVNCPSQETEVTSTPTRPVENVTLNDERPTGKKTQLVSGTTVEK